MNKTELISFDDVLASAMRNPEFANEFNELREQRKLAETLKKARLCATDRTANHPTN